jgi:hypothetical protein
VWLSFFGQLRRCGIDNRGTPASHCGFTLVEVMPNRAIEIHDSTLADISLLQSEAKLHFASVYIHQSEGIPGRDAGSVWVQKAIIRISDAKVRGTFSEFPVHLSGGQILMGQNCADNIIPVPLHHKGAFELRLETWRQAREVVTFTGSGAELELLGEPEYLEEFRP